MIKKMFKLSMFLVLTQLFCCVANAANTWNNNASNNLYNDPGNWSGAVPIPFGTTGTADVYIGLDDPDHAVINSTMGIMGGNNTYIGQTTNGKLEINGGTFQTRLIKLGNNADGTMIATDATISQDIAAGTGRYFDVGCENGTTGHLELNGSSTLTTGISKFGLGRDAGSVGTAVLNDDAYVASLYIHLGNNGSGTLTLNGNAAFQVTNTIWLPQGAGTGHLQLNSGVMQANDLIMRNNGGVGTIDIEAGRLILNGNSTGAVTTFVSNNWITAYGGADEVDVYYDSDNDRTIVQAYSHSQNFGIATEPSPAIGYIGMPVNIIFRWKLLTAGTRNFYLGTSYSAVNNATPASPEFKGSTTNNYFITPLDFSTNYYWKVDYVDFSDTYSSDIFSFSTQAPSAFIAEGFESYLSTTALKNVWEDGSSNGTGSSIMIEDETNNNTYKGQGMKFGFDNTTGSYKSEAVLDYSTGKNWSVGNIEALTIHYLGDPDVDGFYVSLYDGSSWATQRIDDADKLSKQKWQEFNFALEDFTGISLSNIMKLKIGIANQALTPGQSGTVYIDEIELNKVRCVAEFAPRADFDGDCDVDINDMVKLVDVWLESGYSVTPSEPGSLGLVAYYPLDSISESIAYDMSGNGHNGTVDANGISAWSDSGYNNGCMEFDGTFGITLPVSLFSGITDHLTISAWVNSDVVDATGDYRAAQFGAGQIPVGQNDYQWSGLTYKAKNTADYSGNWNHYAFVINGSLMQIYNNGILIAKRDDADIDIADTGITRIGTDDQNLTDMFIGKLDELKIFNRALSHEEIAYLAGGPVNQPLTPAISPVDPYADGVINLLDYAEMSNKWLEVILWP